MGCKTTNWNAPHLFQNVGYKGRNSDKPEIHTDPLLTFALFVYDFEPSDSLGWQLYQSILHFVTWIGYKVAPDCLENFGWGKLLQQS